MRNDTHLIQVVDTSVVLVVISNDHWLSFVFIGDLRTAMLGAEQEHIFVGECRRRVCAFL